MPYVFKFYVENDLVFKTILKSFQCIGHNKNHQRCKRICVIGENYCWTHLMLEKQLRILDSTVVNAGKGLFAMNPKAAPDAVIFKKGDTIGEYLGERLTEAETDERYGNNTAPYAIKLKKNVIIDAAGERGYASLCNEARKRSERNADLISIFNTKPQKVILRAFKNIQNGEEILTWYGNEYDQQEKFTTKYVK